MAKTTKSAKSDRQKRIDEAMRVQKKGDRRRGFAITGVALLVALVIVGAAAYRPLVNWFDDQQLSGDDVDQVGASASVCQPVETKKASNVSDHRPETEQITYPDAPPAYGPHWNVAGLAPAAFDRKFYDASNRPELEALVHNLEHGYTILWYDQSVADDSDQLNEIRAIAKKFDISDTNYRLKFIAAPWTAADEKESGSLPDGAHIAFTHWAGDATNTASANSTGVWQYCSDVSGAALVDFMTEYPYTDSPEPASM